MNITPPTISEIAFRQCIEMLKINPIMMTDYYTSLFLTFKSLLNDEDVLLLNNMIKDFEIYISDPLNPLTLQELELRMANNMDLLSGLEVRGNFVTQLDMQNKLQIIKNWLTQKLYQYMYSIRFTTPINMN